MPLAPYCLFQRGHGPVVAAAIHDGHDLRPDVEARLALNEEERKREEDPVTGEFAQVAKTQIVALRSRFEVDLNRPREKAVYQAPEDAWGLSLWRKPPDRNMIEQSLKEYDEFYSAAYEVLSELAQEFGHVAVYDLHTYNYRREGADAVPADDRSNPEVNVGTGTMDRQYWAPVVERFIAELHEQPVHGHKLDVRENVKFQGGHFGKWIHETFPRSVCAIAIEFRKSFMDEWTGEVDSEEVETLYNALNATIPGVTEELETL